MAQVGGVVQGFIRSVYRLLPLSGSPSLAALGRVLV